MNYDYEDEREAYRRKEGVRRSLTQARLDEINRGNVWQLVAPVECGFCGEVRPCDCDRAPCSAGDTGCGETPCICR